MDALTAAYGSAYCMVRLTRGPRSGMGRDGGLDWVGPVEKPDGLTKPDGAGSEKAPYASKLGLPGGGTEEVAAG
jgi:hypothetical protein